MKLVLIAFMICNLLASCMTPTPIAPPPADAPATFRGDTVAGPSPATLPWEQLYTDPVLQGLIKAALAHNYTVAQAYQTVIIAESNLGIVSANQQPYVNGALSAPYDVTTGNRPGGVANTTFTPQFGISAGYQVDLFGKLASATAASRQQLFAQEAAANIVVETLVSQVASSYFTLLELDSTLAYSLGTEKDDRENLRLIKLRVQYGENSIQDQYQAEQALYQVTSEIPQIRQQIAQTENAISVETGSYPHDIPRGAPLKDQLKLPEVPSTGLPGELLTRRPDIAKAEHDLAAASANVDVARASIYPSLTIGASAAVAGSQSTGLYPNLPPALAFLGAVNNTFYGPLGLFSLVPQLATSIFNSGALQSQVRLAKAQREQLVYGYLQTVLNAFAEVSDAVVSYDQSRARRVQLQLNADVSEKSYVVAQQRYEQGETSYLEVLTANTNLYQAKVSLEQGILNERLAYVQLYLTLGGGWQG